MRTLLLSFTLSLSLSASAAFAQSQALSADYYPVQNRDCKIWNPAPVPNETVYWTGKCIGGQGEGRGIIVYGKVVNGRAVMSVSDVVLKSGKQIGHGEYFSSAGVFKKNLYADGRRQTSNDFTYGDYMKKRAEADGEIAASKFQDGLVKNVDKDDLEEIIKLAGFTVGKSGHLPFGNPAIIFSESSDIKYLAVGTACSKRCKGILLSASFKRTAPISFSELNQQNIKYAIVSAARSDTKSNYYSTSRYLILDGGQPPENIKASIRNFTSASKSIAKNLGAVNDSGDEK